MFCEIKTHLSRFRQFPMLEIRLMIFANLLIHTLYSFPSYEIATLPRTKHFRIFLLTLYTTLYWQFLTFPHKNDSLSPSSSCHTPYRVRKSGNKTKTLSDAAHAIIRYFKHKRSYPNARFFFFFNLAHTIIICSMYAKDIVKSIWGTEFYLKY